MEAPGMGPAAPTALDLWRRMGRHPHLAARTGPHRLPRTALRQQREQTAQRPWRLEPVLRRQAADSPRITIPRQPPAAVAARISAAVAEDSGASA